MCKLNCTRTNNMAAGISLNYSIEFLQFPQLTNLWLLTTAVAVWSAPCTTVAVNTWNTTDRCRGCCQSDDSRACSEIKAIEPKTQININDRHVYPDCLIKSYQRCSTAMTPRPWQLWESFPTTRQHYKDQRRE